MKKAFTLFEILIVLFLISLTLSIVFPRLNTNFSSPKNFLGDLEDLFYLARKKSIIENISLFLIIDPHNRKIFLSSVPVYNEDVEIEISIPEEVEIKGERLLSFSNNYKGFFFWNSGLCSGGVLEIINLNNRSQTIIYVPKSQWLLSKETN